MKSIIFNAEEVRATLEGNKTQFRAPLKTQPIGILLGECLKEDGKSLKDFHAYFQKPKEKWLMEDKPTGTIIKCPFGKIGDEIFVKESWCLTRASQSYECGDVYYFKWEGTIEEAKKCLNDDMVASSSAARIFYPADSEDENPSEMYDTLGINGKILSKKEIPWLSASKMPQWASRITLRIKNIRVERLEEISEEDCLKEGVNCWGGYRIGGGDDYADPQYFFGEEEKLPCTCYETEEGPEMCGNCLWGSPVTYDNPFEPFIEYWDDKYPKHSSASNPFVWVVEFETIN